MSRDDNLEVQFDVSTNHPRYCNICTFVVIRFLETMYCMQHHKSRSHIMRKLSIVTNRSWNCVRQQIGQSERRYTGQFYLTLIKFWSMEMWTFGALTRSSVGIMKGRKCKMLSMKLETGRDYCQELKQVHLNPNCWLQSKCICNNNNCSLSVISLYMKIASEVRQSQTMQLLKAVAAAWKLSNITHPTPAVGIQSGLHFAGSLFNII